MALTKKCIVIFVKNVSFSMFLGSLIRNLAPEVRFGRQLGLSYDKNVALAKQNKKYWKGIDI